MTEAEARERYAIPHEILDEYSALGLCGAELDDEDLERLGVMMTLRDVGFDPGETKRYMRLALEPGTEAERLSLLDRRRDECLDDIHEREKRLFRLDYLRHELRRKCSL